MTTNTPLRSARLRRRITQLDLAIRADCSLNTVALAERGGRVSPEMAAKFARILGVSAEDLMRRPELPALK